MIASRADLQSYRVADGLAHGVTGWTWKQSFSALSRDRILRFQRRLRLIEYLTNCSPRGARLRLAVLWRVHARHAERLGFTLPVNVFGPGLCLAHHGTITVNELARVGARCRIHPSTTLGRSDDGAPVIGDDCYIGPGARLIGPITLGNGVTVGANAVVTHSFGDGAVLAGVPAREIDVLDAPVWRH